MLSKRTIICIGLLLVLALTPGCLWLRLLQVKKQLADFEHCIQVKEDKGLKMIFLKPTLYSGDIQTLLDRPTFRKKTGGNKQWTFVFEKVYAEGRKNETDNFDVSLDMIFKNDLLSEIHLPERFLVILPKSFLIMLCKTMGNAEINMAHQSVKGTFKYREKEASQIQIPKKDEILKFLGKSFAAPESDVNLNLLYRYQLKPTTANQKYFILSWINFTFGEKESRLLTAEANLCGIELFMDFSTDSKDDKNPDNK